jgi:hypothetical protein
MRQRGRLPDPSWKSGPKEQKPTSSKHAIDHQPSGEDFDGLGTDEAEMVEGEPLLAIQERTVCHRDGCDAAMKRRLLFTTDPLSDAEIEALEIVSGLSEPSEYVFNNAERIDCETIRVDGTTITAETSVIEEPVGPCHGRVEPDPEPEWRGR